MSNQKPEESITTNHLSTVPSYFFGNIGGVMAKTAENIFAGIYRDAQGDVKLQDELVQEALAKQLITSIKAQEIISKFN